MFLRELFSKSPEESIIAWGCPLRNPIRGCYVNLCRSIRSLKVSASPSSSSISALTTSLCTYARSKRRLSSWVRLSTKTVLPEVVNEKALE